MKTINNHLAQNNNATNTELIEALNKALDKKNYQQIINILENLPNDALKKEHIILAIKSNNPRILELISNKTLNTHFDKSILMQAIQTKNTSIVDIIINKTESSLFDKHVIYEALKTKDKNLFNKIAHKTPPTVFNKELLEKAIDERNPDNVRAIVNYTTDKELLLKYKNPIQHSILKKDDILNLTGQLLNLESNLSEDKEIQELVLDMYLNIVKKYHQSEKLPKNFNMKLFEDSVKESRYFFSCPHKINFNSLTNKDKFLVLPIITFGHVFSAVVRRINEDKISITFVNLGNNFNEKNSSQSDYKEFIYSNDIALKILKGHSYNVRLYPERIAIDSEQAYERFEKYALKSFPLNVSSRPQKVGNCFTKNIEKGLRFALATQLTNATSNDFNLSMLRKSKDNENSFKVKFLKPLVNKGMKIKDRSTLPLKNDLVDALIKRFPNHKEDIFKKWNYYKSSKLKRPSKNLLQL